MSRYDFRTTYKGEPVEVIISWDVPLQGYFMYVERLDGTDEDDEGHFVFSNLYDADDSHPKTLDPFLEVLARLGIEAPADIIDDVKDDARNNR